MKTITNAVQDNEVTLRTIEVLERSTWIPAAWESLMPGVVVRIREPGGRLVVDEVGDKLVRDWLVVETRPDGFVGSEHDYDELPVPRMSRASFAVSQGDVPLTLERRAILVGALEMAQSDGGFGELHESTRKAVDDALTSNEVGMRAGDTRRVLIEGRSIATASQMSPMQLAVERINHSLPQAASEEGNLLEFSSSGFSDGVSWMGTSLWDTEEGPTPDDEAEAEQQLRVAMSERVLGLFTSLGEMADDIVQKMEDGAKG